MPKHADISLEETKLFALYIHEAWWLSNGITQKLSKLFLDTAIPETGYFVEVNAEIHSLIASILSDAANLKKLIISPNNKLDGESGRQYRLRRARTEMLNKTLDTNALKEILNVKVRNTLEHFDEYLDQANLAITMAKHPPSPLAAYNIVMSSWDAIQPRVYPIRLYISGERKFYNMKWSVDMNAINVEATDIANRIKMLMQRPDSPGGLLLPLT